MAIVDDIYKKLAEGLAPTELLIEDESDRHIGHSGSRPGGETHFRVRVVSRAFEGVPRLARHRRVHDLLSDELSHQIHALSIVAQTPDEAGTPHI